MLQSLSEQGCLNPRPQSVTDELFANHEFFDAHDMVQVKYEMLRRVEKDGHSISDASGEFRLFPPDLLSGAGSFRGGRPRWSGSRASAAAAGSQTYDRFLLPGVPDLRAT
jgi:hypothetical protein